MSERHQSARARARRELGLGAVLSADHAAMVLPMADGEARRWLSRNGLIRDLDGREVVRWIDVVEHLGSATESATGARPEPLMLEWEKL